jgi:chorismate mutase/prephenate dehydratase
MLIPVSDPSKQPVTLDTLRTRIDEVDRALVSLLNERAGLAAAIGDIKRASGVAIYAPHREAQVLAKVQAMSAGPLPQRAIEAIYREIMSSSFAIERGLQVAYLGPAGSFSHMAANKHFGANAELQPAETIKGVFAAVARHECEVGLVPVENTHHGGVAETLDGFVQFAGSVFVQAEVQLAVRHVLAAACEPARITHVYSKPEVFAQCRAWLAENLPQAKLVPAASTSAAMKLVAERAGKHESTIAASNAQEDVGGAAAIGSSLAAEMHGLPVLFDGIQDASHNITRFYVIGEKPAQRSGDDKTSVMFKTDDTPGALARVLGDFERSGINLTHIDKRPAGKAAWAYTFFLDACGHDSEPGMQLAIERARQHCQEIVVLGGYPRSKRVL